VNKSFKTLTSIKSLYTFVFLTTFVFISSVVGENLKERFTADYIKNAEQLSTFRSFGTIKMGETIGSFEIMFSEPGKSRSTLVLNNFQITQVFDGRNGWMKDQNGQVSELSGADKRQLINTGWLLGKSYFLDNRMSGETKFLKDTIINSNSYDIFSAFPEGGDSLKMYFNPATSRVEIIGEYLDGAEILTYLSDFREVDGFEMAFVTEAKSDIPELNSKIEIYEFEVNQQLDDTLFAFSITPADDYFFPEFADSIIIPMVYQRGHIFLKAAVDGNQAVYFILDSGAGINFLNRSYADSLKLDLSGGVPAKGISGYEKTTITNLDSLKIGDLKLFQQNVAIVDLTNVGLDAPDGVLGGLLGFDFLSRFPVGIDYVKQTLIVYNPLVYQSPSLDYAINIKYNMKIPIVDAEICGVSGRFLIDLGNALGLILHKPFVDNNNLSAAFTDINKIGRDIAGVGGKSESYSAVAEYFTVGPAQLNELRVLVAEGEQGILKSTDVDGNIGNGLLQNFSIILDYPGQKIYIMPLEN